MTQPVVLPVILCGGAGTRLWPLSRKSFPKPFLKVAGKSLIAQTLTRVVNVFAAGASAEGGALPTLSDVLIVSNEAYEFILKDEAAKALGSAHAGVQVHQLLEPEGRNTAGAVALAAHWAQVKYTGQQVVLLVLPADHLICPDSAFAQASNQAVHAAVGGKLTCFGIKPTSPETGYGYIKVGANALSTGGLVNVEAFVEKPSLEKAVEYLQSGEYLWNGGMFAFDAKVFLSTLKSTDKAVADASQAVWAGADHQAAVTRFDKAQFLTLPDISVDYAVMEKASNVAVVPSSFSWSDIGSFAALSQTTPTDEHGNVLQDTANKGGTEPKWWDHDSHNTHIIASDRAVATLGLNNILIVDTPDALLVADRNRHQDVKKIVAQLNANSETDLADFHKTVHRPWGTYTVLDSGNGYKIKRIEVKQKASLSLQMHHHRSEHWIVVNGTAEVTNGEDTFLVRKNESTYIPAGHRHRLTNPGAMPLVMIEVQSGDYLEEDDIVRLEDKYGRIK